MSTSCKFYGFVLNKNMVRNQTTLLNGRVRLLQTEGGLRASMDSVLLAAAVTAQKGDHILDMGCGTGAVGLCVNGRLQDLKLSITGLDIQEEMIAIARANSLDNGLNDRAIYQCGDVHDKKIFKAESFDHIVMNPPYYEEGKRMSSPDQSREIAYTGELEHWMASALHWLKQGGSLSIIHRADRLDKILSLAHGKYGAIEIWPVQSKPSEPAIRVIIKMLRNRKTPLVIHSPVVMFDQDGEESQWSKSLLREAYSLSS